MVTKFTDLAPRIRINSREALADAIKRRAALAKARPGSTDDLIRIALDRAIREFKAKPPATD